MSTARALRHRSFLILWSGYTVSALGDRLHRVALVWWVLKHTGSGAALGTVAIYATVPQLVFLFIGGVVVDRMSRQRIMLISDLVRAVLTATIAALVLTDQLAIGMVYAISIAFGFVDAFFVPAFNALVPEIVPADDLSSANSLTTLSWQLSGIVGPALGAVFVVSGGTGLAFVTDAATFLISAACLVAVRGLAPAARTAAPNMFRELREGFGVVLAEPWLWITIVFFGLLNSIDGALYSVSLPFLVTGRLGLDIGSLSFVQTAGSIGAVVGAVWLGRRTGLRRRGLFAYGSGVVVGACLVAIALSTTIYGVGAAALIRNTGLTAINLIWFQSVQSIVPSEQQGRVWSIDSFGSYLLMPVGYYAAGWATDHADPSQVFFIGGLVISMLAMLALLHPRIRRLD